MRLTVNGEAIETANDSSVLDVLDLLGMANARVAVELNREIVPRSEHASRRVLEGDVLEVVHAIGGG